MVVDGPIPRCKTPVVMALKDLFRKKSPIEKAEKDLCEPYAQPEVRRGAMSQLLEIGTDAAYRSLLKRFKFNSHGNIADESEKRDLVGHLVAVGEDAVEPIKDFVRKEKAILFPLRALSQIVSREEYVAFVVETLKAIDPLDHRLTESKRVLITVLGDLSAKDHLSDVLPYLGDHHDDVQVQAIEVLERFELDEPGPLAKLCTDETHSARVQRRAAQALEHLKLNVKSAFEAFNDELKKEYTLGKKGTLVKKSAYDPSA